MTRSEMIRQRLDSFFAMLVEAAEAGAPCPNNQQIIERLSYSGRNGCADMFATLERVRLIKVDRAGGMRRVTIVSSGHATDWTEHMTGRIAAGVKRPTSQTRYIGLRDEGEYRGDVPDHRRVDRDPCFNCGARRDVGCRHYPIMAVA